MKTASCSLLLFILSFSINANFRNNETADFIMKCDTDSNGKIVISYASNELRSLEEAQLSLDGEVFRPNMKKTFFSHSVSSYINPITRKRQYTYHGNIQFNSHDGYIFGRAKFYLDKNLSKNQTLSNLYANENVMMNVSLSLRQNKKWIKFTGQCGLSYDKL